MPTTTTQAVSPGYIYTVTASSEAIVRDVETDKLLCKANNGSQGMFIAIGGTVSMTTDDPTATITQASATSGGARFEVQQTRPATGEEGVIYLIPITSSTDEENEYEEWIWIKGEWERLGTTGVNLSNYATLTDANTYSGNNTFNGLLLKSNSASLGDTSVLNRSEADARYGRLAADNTWQGDQTIASGRTLTIHHSATIVANSIRGNDDLKWLSFNDLSLTDIKAIEADKLYVADIAPGDGSNIRMLGNVDATKKITANEGLSIHPDSVLYVNTIHGNGTALINVNSGLNIKQDYGLHANRITAPYIDAEVIYTTSVLYTLEIGAYDATDISIINDVTVHADAKLNTDEIAATTSDAPINIGSELNLQGHNISNVNTLFSDVLSTNVIAPADKTSNKIELTSVKELQFRNTDSGATLSGISALTYNLSTISLGYANNQTIAINGDLNFLERESCIDLNQSGIISGVQTLQNNEVRVICDATSIPNSKSAMLVASPGGIKVTGKIADPPTVTMSIYKIEAFPLDTDSFGENKYGLRITPEACQLFGIDFASNASGSITIGTSESPTGYGSVAIGSETASAAQGVAIGAFSEAKGQSVAIGYDAQAAIGATALGYDTGAQYYGIAIGHYCSASSGMLNISTGGDASYGARCSMLWYGGDTYENRDTGFLQFEIGNTFYKDRYESGAQNDTITISKPNLWSALDRAKYRGAQPYKYYIASAIASIPALEPNSITHIGAYASGAAIDLSGITLSQYDDTVTTAELWIEVTSAGTTITWPEGMLWPDEADPTVAPSFPGPEASTEVGYTTQRLYCVTLRTQRRRNLTDGTPSSVLIASIAYTADSKLQTAGAGGGSS